MKKLLVATGILAASALGAGCENLSSEEKGMLGGAAVGGAVGSAATGGSTIGTIGGAVGGGYLGREAGREYDERKRD